MFKNLTAAFLVFSLFKTTFAMDDLSNMLEKRKISYGNYSIDLEIPKNFEVDQNILKDSMEHAAQYHKNAEKTMKDVVACNLETEFWNQIRHRNLELSVIYLFSAIQAGSSDLIDSFFNVLTDIDPKIIKEVRGQSIQDQATIKKIKTVVNILISNQPSSAS